MFYRKSDRYRNAELSPDETILLMVWLLFVYIHHVYRSSFGSNMQLNCGWIVGIHFHKAIVVVIINVSRSITLALYCSLCFSFALSLSLWLFLSHCAHIDVFVCICAGFYVYVCDDNNPNNTNVHNGVEWMMPVCLFYRMRSNQTDALCALCIRVSENENQNENENEWMIDCAMSRWALGIVFSAHFSR